MYSKSMGKLRKKIDVKLVSNKKDYLKWISKPSYMSQKICGNNVVTRRESKVALALKKPAYTGMSILDLSKVLMYEFHYDFIENEYGKQLKTIGELELTVTCIQVKLKIFIKILVRIKKCLALAIVRQSQSFIMIQTNYYFVK